MKRLHGSTHAALALAAGIAVHLAAVWAAPRLIMHKVLSGVQAEQPAGGVLLPPPTDHTQRRIVMPSPDLLYAVCALDIGQRPWRVRAQAQRPGAQGYWSVALYGANTDNVFVIGDRDLGAAPLDLVVSAPGAAMPAGVPADARRVHVDSGRVLLLMRVLVGDRSRDLPEAEAARRTLRCDPA